MGGRGSGHWYRWDKKPTIDGHKRLDVRYLHRDKLLRPGFRSSLDWTINGHATGSITVVVVNRNSIVLRYNWRRGNYGEFQPVDEWVTLSWTLCHYGGERPWFLCPRCGRRVAVLVAGGRLFLCRHCYGLHYASQHETELDRATRKAQKLKERLGDNSWIKPKGMHQRTFDRLRWKLIRAEERAQRLFIAEAARWLGYRWHQRR